MTDFPTCPASAAISSPMPDHRVRVHLSALLLPAASDFGHVKCQECFVWKIESQGFLFD